MHWNVLVYVAIFCSSVVAQTPQDDWLAPPLPQSQTYLNIGSEYTLSWTQGLKDWFQQYAPAADPKDVDLWFVSINGDTYHHQIATGLDITTTLSYDWNVSIPESELQATVNWCFRFRKSGFTYSDNSTGEVSSPAIILRDAVSSSSSGVATSTSSSTPTSTSSVSSATTTTSASSTQSSKPSTSSGISAGAIAGIALGSAIIALFLAAIAFVFWRRRKTSQPGHATGSPQTTQHVGCYAPVSDKQGNYNELPDRNSIVHRELPG